MDPSIYRPITCSVRWTIGVMFTSIMTHIWFNMIASVWLLKTFCPSVCTIQWLWRRHSFQNNQFFFFHTLDAYEFRRERFFSHHFARYIIVYTHFEPSDQFWANDLRDSEKSVSKNLGPRCGLFFYIGIFLTRAEYKYFSNELRSHKQYMIIYVFGIWSYMYDQILFVSKLVAKIRV